MNKLKNTITVNALDKHWVRNYSLFFLTSIGQSHSYINSDKFLGEVFTLALFTYQNGESSYYRLDAENRVFLEKFGTRILAEDSFKQLIIDEYESSSKRILEIYSEINDLTLISAFFLINLADSFAQVVCYQLVVHRIVDYLNQIEGAQKTIQEFITVRTKYESVFGEVELNMDKIFRVLSHQTGLSKKILKLFSVDELITYLDNGLVDIEKIKLREKGCIINTLPGLDIISSATAIEILNLIEQNIHKQYSKNSVTGKAVLNFNKISGEAVCIARLEDIENIDIANKIIIAHSTIPKYNHLYTKALAIITEEGGLLAHASVLAREFKIPTIIGVKNALSQIKTGDVLVLEDGKITKV